MKKLLIGLALTGSMAAQAQTSTASASATTAAPETQTSTASVAQTAPKEASKFGATVIVMTSANVADYRRNNSRLLIDSANSLGVSYKINDTFKTEVRHNFSLRNKADQDLLADQSENTLNSEQGAHSPYKSFDPTVHLNIKTPVTVLGSAPLSIGTRYYVPVTQDSLNARSNGVLRYQTALSWDLTPKFNFEAAFQQRVYMYKAAAENNGAVLRTLPSLTGTYSFNDDINAYYSPSLDLRASGASRGNYKADRTNQLWQEVGMNFVVGAVTINPAWATVATRAQGKEGYEGAGKDENTEYDLNIFANF